MSNSLLDTLCRWHPQQSRHHYQIDETGRIRIVWDCSASAADDSLPSRENEGARADVEDARQAFAHLKPLADARGGGLHSSF